jgi:hypothetical protein
MMHTQMKAREKKNPSSTSYSAWFGRSVVLVVLVRQCDVPMHCSIVGESVAALRARIEPGWEMDIPKELILGIEEDAVASGNRIN